MRLKAIPSSSGMAIAVSSRLCPSSYRRIKFCSLITFPHCVSTRSNVRASPIAVAVESSMPEGSSSTAAAFQKIRVILNWRMRRRIASTFQSLSSTTISMGNIIPQVCTPCDGTISSPSPCESLLSPSRPTILLNPVSATRIHSPRTVPLVVLTARTVLFCNRIKLLGKILKHFLQVDNRRSQRYHEDAGEDEKHQGKKKLHAGLGRHLFSCLHAAGTQRVCKNAERMGDRRAKTLGLHQHGDKLPDEFNIQAFRHAAPCVQTRLAGALLAIDDLELFRQAWGGDRHFLAHAPAKTPSAWAIGVPKRAVCTSMVTNCRTNSISRRSAMLRHASKRGLPARCSRLDAWRSSARLGAVTAISSPTRTIAWSMPSPASMQITSRSSASGRAMRIFA